MMPAKTNLPLFSTVILILTGALTLAAQTAEDNTDVQQWNDVTVVKPLTKKVDLLIPFTFRFTQNISRFNEGRVGIGVTFKPTTSVSLNSTYLYIRARNSSQFAPEHRVSAYVSYKFPVKAVGLSHRSMLEFRHRRSGNTWRYRPSITVERSLPKSWLDGARVYVTEEPFYDSAAGRFSRNRLSFGFGKSLTKHLNLDVYYLRQDDRNSTVRLSHIIGTSWKVKLD